MGQEPQVLIKVGGVDGLNPGAGKKIGANSATKWPEA